MLVCTPSSDRWLGITTTALHGECRNDFGGTSAAAPMVAGVVALMLEARPNATWRDVRTALVVSAIPTDIRHPSWIVNGAGRSFSPYYGFGRVDAGLAVDAILRVNTAPAVSIHTAEARPRLTILSDESWSESSIRVEASHPLTVECVEATVHIQHPHRGDLEVELISPMNTLSILATHHSDRKANYEGWTFTTCACWGESGHGVWRLRIRDLGTHRRSSIALLERWQLVVHGS
jgi:kexin